MAYLKFFILSLIHLKCEFNCGKYWNQLICNKNLYWYNFEGLIILFPYCFPLPTVLLLLFLSFSLSLIIFLMYYIIVQLVKSIIELKLKLGTKQTYEAYVKDSKKVNYFYTSRRRQKIYIGKPFNKSISIDINHVNVIDCIDQLIKVDTHNSSGNYCKLSMLSILSMDVDRTCL